MKAASDAAIDFVCRAGNLHVLFWRCAQVWKMFSSGTSVLFCFGSSYTYTRTHTHAHIAHAFRWPHNAHIHTCTHTYTHIFTHDSITHIHTTFTYYCIHSFHAPPFDIHSLHTPILHHLFSFSCMSHSIFTFLLLLIGRS